MLLLMQNSIYKIKYLLFLSWDWRRGIWLSLGGGQYPPPERNTAWNKGRKYFHCLGAPNNLIRPCPAQSTVFTAPIFLKQYNSVQEISKQYNCLDISYTELYPNRTKYAQNMNKSLLTSVSKLRLSLHRRFSRNSEMRNSYS